MKNVDVRCDIKPSNLIYRRIPIKIDVLSCLDLPEYTRCALEFHLLKYISLFLPRQTSTDVSSLGMSAYLALIGMSINTKKYIIDP